MSQSLELFPLKTPFENIFPNLIGYLSKEFYKNHLFTGEIDKTSNYGQAHMIATSLERQISHMRLIMHRIRCDLGINLGSGDSYNIDNLYLPVDVISFFVWMRSSFDSVANLTQFFYEEKSIPGKRLKSFRRQKDWFITEAGSRLDPNYSKYLKENTKWFDRMRDIRDGIVHQFSWMYTDKGATGRTVLKKMEGNALQSEIESVAQLIGQNYSNFCKFSDFYQDHFSQILQSKGHVYRETSTRIVGKYARSLECFLVAVD